MVTQKRGRGRPFKPAAEKQGERLLVYLNARDAKLVRSQAAKRGQTPSMFFADLWREWCEAGAGRED